MANSQHNSDFIDIKALLDSYKRHWWWFALSVTVCVGLAFLYTKFKSPVYSIHANVIITDDKTNSLTSMSGLSDIFGSSANVEDEMYVLNSHSVLRDVAKELGLNEIHVVKRNLIQKRFMFRGYPITVYTPEGLCDTLSTSISFKIDLNKKGLADIEAKAKKETIADLKDVKLPATLSTPYGKFVVDRTTACPKDKSVNTLITVKSYDAAAEDLAKEIHSDKASKKSNMLRLNMKTPNVEFGKDVLNAIMAQYNRRGIDESTLQGNKTLEFIDSRLANLSGDLSEAEGNIERYKEGRGIVDVQSEAAYNMQARGHAEQSLVKAQTNSEIIRMTRDFLTQPENAYQIIPVSAEIPSASSAIATYNTLIMQRMDLMQNARGNNRALRQLDEQIDAMRASINSTLAKAYETSQIGVAEARGQMSKAMGKLGNVPTQEREFLNLKRQQEVKQQLYLFLLQRREETAMLIANAIPKGRIVDEAYMLSKPLGMGRMMMLLFAFVLGLCIPPIILAIKKMLRNKFENADEVKSRVSIPVLGEICTTQDNENLVVKPNETSSAAELFRALRSRLSFIVDGDRQKVILVTSTRSGEGKSFVSVNFSATLSLLHKKVILVGMDIRNPSLAEYLGLSNAKGVTTFLSRPDSTDVNSLIQKVPGADGLDVIVAGPIPPNPGELLASDGVAKLMDKLRQEYDFIIVDSAPVGMVSDTFNLENIADATMYVCRANYTTLTDLDFAQDIYDEHRLPKVTLVVNGTKTSKGYGYGYGQKSAH